MLNLRELQVQLILSTLQILPLSRWRKNTTSAASMEKRENISLYTFTFIDVFKFKEVLKLRADGNFPTKSETCAFHHRE